jgi:hypothetical protein
MTPTAAYLLTGGHSTVARELLGFSFQQYTSGQTHEAGDF